MTHSWAQEGIPIERLDDCTDVCTAFQRHISEARHPPEQLYALPVYCAGLYRDASNFAYGLSANVSVRSYPVLAPGMPLHTEAGMSAALASLAVLKDHALVDRPKRDAVVAGMCRAAAAGGMASVAPMAVALKMFIERSLLRQPHKAALVCGMLAACAHVFASLRWPAHRLLELTPRLLAWLCMPAARALTEPALQWRPVSLRALDGRDVLDCPCKIPGHEQHGIFNMDEALSLASVLSVGADTAGASKPLAPTDLVQDEECYELMRLAARVLPGTTATLWPLAAGCTLAARGSPAQLPTARWSRSSADGGAFTVFSPLEVKQRKHTSLTRHRRNGRAVVVAFEPLGSGGGGQGGGKGGEAQCAKGGATPDGAPTQRGRANLFLPLRGETITVDLANVARDAAQHPDAWRHAPRSNDDAGPLVCGPAALAAGGGIRERLRQLSVQLAMAEEDLLEEGGQTAQAGVAGTGQAPVKRLHDLRLKRASIAAELSATICAYGSEVTASRLGGVEALGGAEGGEGEGEGEEEEEEEALRRMASIARRPENERGGVASRARPAVKSTAQASRGATTRGGGSPPEAPALRGAVVPAGIVSPTSTSDVPSLHANNVSPHVEDDGSTARAYVAEATMLVLDVSASMQTRCFRPSGGSDAPEGASKVLFVAMRGSKRADVPADLAHVSAGLSQHVSRTLGLPPPVNVRLHRHLETEQWKGTCHLEWQSVEEAERAYAALQAADAPRLWGQALIVDRCAADTPRSARRQLVEVESRLAVCKLALERYTERAVALDLASAAGVLLVGSDIALHCRLTAALRLFAERAASAMTDDEQVERRGGRTRLHRALECAAAELATFGARQAALEGATRPQLRILAVTDGEDTSDDCPLHALQVLRERGVVVDVVVLGGPSNGMMAALAEATGGMVLQPVSERDALMAFESEALLQLASRRVVTPHAKLPSLPELHRHAKQAKCRLLATMQRAAVSGEGGRRPTEDEVDPQPGGMMLAAPTEGGGATAGVGAAAMLASELASTVAASAAVSGGGVTAPPRLVEEAPSRPTITRILHELAACRNHPHEELQVFPHEQNILTWEAVLSCPITNVGVLYAGGAWRLRITFPRDYPERAPTVHFVTPILHLNVNRDGRVCHSALDRDYSPEHSMPFLLQALVALLVLPDADDPFNEPLAIVYNASRRGHRELPPPDVDTRYKTLVREAVIRHASTPAEELIKQLTRESMADAAASPSSPTDDPPTLSDSESSVAPFAAAPGTGGAAKQQSRPSPHQSTPSTQAQQRSKPPQPSLRSAPTTTTEAAASLARGDVSPSPAVPALIQVPSATTPAEKAARIRAVFGLPDSLPVPQMLAEASLGLGVPISGLTLLEQIDACYVAFFGVDESASRDRQSDELSACPQLKAVALAVEPCGTVDPSPTVARGRGGRSRGRGGRHGVRGRGGRGMAVAAMQSSSCSNES